MSEAYKRKALYFFLSWFPTKQSCWKKAVQCSSSKGMMFCSLGTSTQHVLKQHFPRVVTARYIIKKKKEKRKEKRNHNCHENLLGQINWKQSNVQHQSHLIWETEHLQIEQKNVQISETKQDMLTELINPCHFSSWMLFTLPPAKGQPIPDWR